MSALGQVSGSQPKIYNIMLFHNTSTNKNTGSNVVALTIVDNDDDEGVDDDDDDEGVGDVDDKGYLTMMVEGDLNAGLNVVALTIQPLSGAILTSHLIADADDTFKMRFVC